MIQDAPKGSTTEEVVTPVVVLQVGHSCDHTTIVARINNQYFGFDKEAAEEFLRQFALCLPFITPERN